MLSLWSSLLVLIKKQFLRNYSQEIGLEIAAFCPFKTCISCLVFRLSSHHNKIDHPDKDTIFLSLQKFLLAPSQSRPPRPPFWLPSPQISFACVLHSSKRNHTACVLFSCLLLPKITFLRFLYAIAYINVFIFIVYYSTIWICHNLFID